MAQQERGISWGALAGEVGEDAEEAEDGEEGGSCGLWSARSGSMVRSSAADGDDGGAG